MESLETELLKRLADRKLHLLTHIRDLSIDQQAMVSEQRVEELLVLLSRKSEAIEELQRIQDELKPFQHQEPNARSWKLPSDRDQCRATFERCETLIAELLTMENESLTELTQRRDIVAEQLNQYVTADTIHEAYQASVSSDSESSSFSLDG